MATRSYGTYRIEETSNVGAPDHASGIIMNGFDSREAAVAALDREVSDLIRDGCDVIPSEHYERLVQLPDGHRVGYKVLLNVWRD